MQIKHIACSNIYNFSFKADLHIPYHGVNFDINPDTSDIHIVIGSSGSGKSQFFRIFNQLWSHIRYHSIKCNLNILDIEDGNFHTKNDQVLSYSQAPFLFETFHEQKMPGTLIVQIHLGSVDLVKLNWLNQHIGELNMLIKQYSNHQEISLHTYQGICDREYLTLQYDIDYSRHKVSLVHPDTFGLFVHQYLKYYNLIKYCIIVHNRVVDGADMRHHRDSLFDHINALRDQDMMGMISMMHQNTTPHHNITAALQICRMMARGSSHSSLYQKTYQDIVYYMDVYLDLKLQISLHDQKLQLLFINHRKEKLRFDQLSSSDQSCIIIILHIIGSMTRFGILILEEPEIHLHPQYQLIVAQLLHEISKSYHLQIIINTNSSLMINENNIDNVFRLYTSTKGIHIVNPIIVEEGNEARLSQILNFTNSAKLFFVDTIILVEGETDEYFFRKYFHDMSLKHNHHKFLNTFQIININGKGGLKMWSDFLSKFQINYRFIGDRDNIVETGIDLDIGKYLHQVKKHHHNHMSKSDQYDEVIYQIKTQSPKLRDKILYAIQEAKKKHILILSQGDFESYLGLQSKGLDTTIAFMQENYPKWQIEYRFSSARQELKSIYDLIFGNT